MKRFLVIALTSILCAVMLAELMNGQRPGPSTQASRETNTGSTSVAPTVRGLAAQSSSNPTLAGSPRITFDRGPARPGERPTRVRDRGYFAEHFDRFVRESRATDEQVQALLLALFDYQEQWLALYDDNIRGLVSDEMPEDDDSVVGVWVDLYDMLQRRIETILPPSQMKAWNRICGRCHSRLRFPYHDRILELAP